MNAFLATIRRRPPSAAAIAVAALAIAVFFTDLGMTSLPSRDDAYHAQTAKEMLQRADPIGISYGGTYSFQSSPLPNWLMALSYLIFGIGEYAARFPSALLAVIGVLLVYFFARERWGEPAGVAAAFILLTTSLYLRYGRHAMAEVPLAVLCTLSLLALIEARRRERFYVWFGVAAGLAILTKSALGALPLIIAPVYLASIGEGRRIFSRRFIGACLIAAGVAAIWYVPALLLHGSVFIDSHLGAYLGTHALNGHHAAMGAFGLFYYLLWIPVQMLPWSLLLIPALVWAFRQWRQDEAIPALWLMVVVPIVLLSLITSKYTRYLMPVFPAAALLIVAVWSRRLSLEFQRRAAASIGILATVAAVAIVVLPLDLAMDRNDEVRDLAPLINRLADGQRQLLNYRMDFFTYQNPLLFYTDRTLAQPADDPGKAVTELDPGNRLLGIAPAGSLGDLQKAALPGTDIEAVETAGSVLLYKVRAPAYEEYRRELRQFATLIGLTETADVIGSYRIPRESLNTIMHEEFGLEIMPSYDKPKRLFRTMERRNTHTGLAWRGYMRELSHMPVKTHEVTFLAYSEHFVLFTIEAIPGALQSDDDADEGEY